MEARKLFWFLLLQDHLQDVKAKQNTSPRKPPSNKNKIKNRWNKACFPLSMVLTARWHLLRWHILLHFSGDLLSCHSAALHAFSVEVSQRPPFLLAAPVMWSRLHPWFRSKPCFSGLTEPVLCIPRGRSCCSGMSTESSRTQEGATGSGRGCWFKVSHFSLLDVSPEKWGSGSDFHTWGERLTEKGAQLPKGTERCCQVTSTGCWIKLFLKLVYPWTFQSACARVRVGNFFFF